MSWRWRIILAVVVVAMLPAGVLGYLLRELTLSQARTAYELRLTATTESAERRVNERRRREREAVARLCEGDIVVDRLMLDLEAGRFGPVAEDDLKERVPQVMRSMGLAGLLLLDGRSGEPYGRVFASGHYPGRAGANASELARAAESADDGWFVHSLTVRRDGTDHEVSAVLTGCVVRRGAYSVIAVGGQVLDDDYVDSLAADVEPVHLVLTGADGELPADVSAGGGRREVYTFDDLDGQPVAHLVATVDDRPLERRMAAFDQRLLYTLGGALIGAILLGLLLALGVTRPLAELERAASRVASGEMNTTITVNAGGEVGKALSAFNHMTEELKANRARLIRAERIAAWRDIARRIAHEIKNPLMPIQTAIETMQRAKARKLDVFDEIFDESTVMILEEVGRLKRIVTEFSRFARMPRPKPQRLNVEEVIKHVVGMHAGGAASVKYVVEGEVPEVRADREQLTQVLVNLVQNACDAATARHGETGAEVDVVIAPAPGGVRVEIIDNGPGITAEEQARIFEPYYTTKAGGTGLGLAIVHRIINDHGGSIDIDDAEGGGAVFDIFLTVDGPPYEASTTATDAEIPLVQRRP